MLPNHHVEKPKKRSQIRQILGKEYFILKRKWKWFKERHTFAKVDTQPVFEHSVIKHQSLLLRPLKDVDMILQHNKIKTLKLPLAILPMW
jgi:vancomycin resistance protein VanW